MNRAALFLSILLASAAAPGQEIRRFGQPLDGISERNSPAYGLSADKSTLIESAPGESSTVAAIAAPAPERKSAFDLQFSLGTDWSPGSGDFGPSVAGELYLKADSPLPGLMLGASGRSESAQSADRIFGGTFYGRYAPKALAGDTLQGAVFASFDTSKNANVGMVQAVARYRQSGIDSLLSPPWLLDAGARIGPRFSAAGVGYASRVQAGIGHYLWSSNASVSLSGLLVANATTFSEATSTRGGLELDFEVDTPKKNGSGEVMPLVLALNADFPSFKTDGWSSGVSLSFGF